MTNTIYMLSEKQPDEGKACVLWEDNGMHIQCMFYWGSWFKIDDSGTSYIYYRCASMTDHWAYVIIQYPEKDEKIEEHNLCDRVVELENKLKELEELKDEVAALCHKIHHLETRMTPPVTDPSPYITPYPYNPSIPWTCPPYTPIVYTTTCSVEVPQNK